MTQHSIVAVTDELPTQVREQLPSTAAQNISRLTLTAENTGNRTVRDANVRLIHQRSNLLLAEFTADPRKEVPFSGPEFPEAETIRYSNVTLQPGQRIVANLFLRSVSEPALEVIWSGGGDDIQWVKGTGTALTYSFDRHVIAIVRNFILGEVMGAILPALFLMGGSLLGPILREIFYGASQGDIFNSEVSIGQVLGSVGRLYFFIRIVPHAQQVVRYLVGRKSSESTSVINVRGDVSGGVVVAGSDARLNTEAAPGK